MYFHFTITACSAMFKFYIIDVISHKLLLQRILLLSLDAQWWIVSLGHMTIYQYLDMGRANSSYDWREKGSWLRQAWVIHELHRCKWPPKNPLFLAKISPYVVLLPPTDENFA